MIKKVSVRLFDVFSVSVDGKAITSATQKMTKPWQLFAYLLMKDGEAASCDELLDVLWANDELADAANVLKNTVYALRRELSGAAKPQESPIVFRNNGYATNINIKFITDTSAFEDLCLKADKSKPDAQLEQYRAAVSAYGGDFLPQLDNEPWALLCARRYRSLYVNAAHHLCAILQQESLWDEMLAAASRLNFIEPLDEDGYIYVFRALSHKQMHKAIVTTYNKTERFFADELGIPMSSEIQQIERAAASHINKSEQDLLIITEDLQGTLYLEKPTNGALVCSYDSFKRLFPLMSRNAVRSENLLALLLITVQGTNGSQISSSSLSDAMADLKIIVTTQLRKSDICCRYSRRQYVALLTTDSQESALTAVSRITSGFVAADGAKHIELECKCKMLKLEQEVFDERRN